MMIRFKFQINAVLELSNIQRKLTKYIYLAGFYIIIQVVFLAANQYIIIISEGSSDWSNDAKM